MTAAGRRTADRFEVATLGLMVIRGAVTAFLRVAARDTAAVALDFFSVGLAVLSARWLVAACEDGALKSDTGTETSNARKSRDSVVT